mgnify:CR=1 FL=1
MSSRDNQQEEYTSKEWEKLVKNLKGKHAERMDKLLEDLPDKQFRIVYPKMLEYMMPKLQRKELVRGIDQERVLRIEVINHADQLEQPTIDITHEEE